MVWVSFFIFYGVLQKNSDLFGRPINCELFYQ